MQKELFRKQALQKLHSPDDLEQLVTLTKIYDWLVILIVSILLIMAIVWSFKGRLSIEIHGSGILVNEGGLLSVVSPSEGVLTGVNHLKVGDLVKEGDVLATLSILQQTTNKKASLISPALLPPT